MFMMESMENVCVCGVHVVVWMVEGQVMEYVYDGVDGRCLCVVCMLWCEWWKERWWNWLVV